MTDERRAMWTDYPGPQDYPPEAPHPHSGDVRHHGDSVHDEPVAVLHLPRGERRYVYRPRPARERLGFRR